MSESKITTIGVVGSGFMGGGIAQVAAMGGKEVFLYDSMPEARNKAVEKIKWSLDKLKSKGKFDGVPDEVMNRLHPVEDMESLEKMELVIEAVYEHIPTKKELLEKLGKIVGADSIIATNTSSIPLAQLEDTVPSPERFIGMHFFGPVPIMKLLEIVMGSHTSEKILERVKPFAREIGKTPIVVRKPSPGFLVNRIFNAVTIEALRCFIEGVGTPQDIDMGMKLGYGWSAGPFEVLDNAGLDIVAGVFGVMGGEPPPQIKEMLDKGHMGRKTGQGFYKYDRPGGKRIIEDD